MASVSKPVVYEAPEKPTPVSEDVLKKAVAQAGGTARSGSRHHHGPSHRSLTDRDRLAFRYRYTQAVRVPHSDELLFRAHFTEVAALAERPVV